MNDFAVTICSHGQRRDHRSRPMRGRIAFHVKTARSQATDHGPGCHLTITQSIMGAIDSRSVASIDVYRGIGTIQIAIAAGTG